jgi:hypothetical protein
MSQPQSVAKAPLVRLRHATAVMSCAPPSARRSALACGLAARLAPERCLQLVSVAACAATGVEASALRARCHVCAPAHPARAAAARRASAGGARPPPKGSPSPRRGKESARLAPHRACGRSGG